MAHHGGQDQLVCLLPNGNLFSNERCDNRKGVALTVSGRMSDYAPDGSVVWRIDDPYQHHDARRLPDGAVYAAFTELTDTQKARITGGIPGSETQGGPFGEAIRRVDNHGAVVWEYQNDLLGGQHDAQMLDNGNVLVFANGLYGADLSHSEIWEIDRATKQIVWRYSARDDFTSFYAPHLGGVQRLPSGNTLICEGNKGCIFEVCPNGDIVREFVSPHFVQSQFGQINWLFRCRWYAPEITALARYVSL